MTPYAVMEIGPHRFKIGIHQRAILQKVLMNLIHIMCSGITLLNLPRHLSGTNELNDIITIKVMKTFDTLTRVQLNNDTTSWHGNVSRITGSLCGGIPPVKKGPLMRSFGVFFDVFLNKLLNKQSGCRKFEPPSRSVVGVWLACMPMKEFKLST